MIVILESSNIDKKPKEEVLKNIFLDVVDKQERNKEIVKAYKKGYSQHMIAKVLGLAQLTINGIIKRNTIAIT